MSITWKPGDRAVFGYRPQSEIPPPLIWDKDSLSAVGNTGTIAGESFTDDYGNARIPFKEDVGGLVNPLTACLFPIIEQPPRVQERERELVLK